MTVSTKLVEINSDQSTVIIEQNGEATTVVMSYDYYQALLEQLQKWKPPMPNNRLEQASAEFLRSPSLDELAQRHNVRPVRDIEEVLGPEPPEGEESAEEFIAKIRSWREEDSLW